MYIRSNQSSTHWGFRDNKGPRIASRSVERPREAMVPRCTKLDGYREGMGETGAAHQV